MLGVNYLLKKCKLHQGLQTPGPHWAFVFKLTMAHPALLDDVVLWWGQIHCFKFVVLKM